MSRALIGFLSGFINKILEHLSYWYRVFVTRDSHLIQVRRWYRDNGDNNLRYSYPLSNSSVVFDVGGYEGDWAKAIEDKYDCYIYIFEPVKDYYCRITDRFRLNPKIKAFNFGLAGATGNAELSMNADGSSIFGTTGLSVSIALVDISEFIEKERIGEIGLIKINIEGGEFELLQRMIDTSIVRNCRDIQIQFHKVLPDADSLRDQIRKELQKTHYLTYDYPFVWENWSRE